MTQCFNPMSKEDKIKSILQRLPKKIPSVTFEKRLMANIRKIDAGENISLLNNSKINWKIATLSTAAGLVLAIGLFNTGSDDNNNTNQKLKFVNKTVKIKSDSTKNNSKNFDRKLNLVGDKKKKRLN